MNSIEQNHKQEIWELTNAHGKLVAELNEKYSTQKDELNKLWELHEISTKDSASDKSSLEKKFNELTLKEKRLDEEVKVLKAERDWLLLSHQEDVSKEKSTYKAKLQASDAKVREVEKKNTLLNFEIEKEKAAFGMKEDHLKSQLSESHENTKRLDRKVEQLTRENARLKNENRNNRKFMYSGNQSNTSYLGGNSWLGGVLSSYNH